MKKHFIYSLAITGIFTSLSLSASTIEEEMSEAKTALSNYINNSTRRPADLLDHIQKDDFRYDGYKFQYFMQSLYRNNIAQDDKYPRYSFIGNATVETADNPQKLRVQVLAKNNPVPGMNTPFIMEFSYSKN